MPVTLPFVAAAPEPSCASARTPARPTSMANVNTGNDHFTSLDMVLLSCRTRNAPASCRPAAAARVIHGEDGRMVRILKPQCNALDRAIITGDLRWLAVLIHHPAGGPAGLPCKPS